jgi:deoxyribonuclease V
MTSEFGSWPRTAAEAIAIQNQLSAKLVLDGDLYEVDLIAGADVSSLPGTNLMVGAVVVWSVSKREVIAQATAISEATFPYIPGLLAFRELPALLEAFRNLTQRRKDAKSNNSGPLRLGGFAREYGIDAVICDGQGIAHPRRFGIACHLGLCLDIPTVGCAKSRLIGEYQMPKSYKGSQTPLTRVSSIKYQEKNSAIRNPKSEIVEIGRVLRTCTDVKPIFVSPGHLIGMEAAVKLVLRCCTSYRLPEPIRAAHRLAGETMRKELKVKNQVSSDKGKVMDISCE